MNQTNTEYHRYLPKHLLDVIPTFDGNNIAIEYFIERLRLFKRYINPSDEKLAVPHIIGKLAGQAYEALKNTTFENIDEFIDRLRVAYPNEKDVYALRTELAQIQQGPNEQVLTYINRLKNLVGNIIEAHKKEEGIGDADLNGILNRIKKQAAKYFKAGIKDELKIDLVNLDDLEQLFKKAIESESFLQNRRKENT